MMRRSTISVVAALALVSTDFDVTAQSSDALMATFQGAWKLNLAKSTYDPGLPPKSIILGQAVDLFGR